MITKTIVTCFKLILALFFLIFSKESAMVYLSALFQYDNNPSSILVYNMTKWIARLWNSQISRYWKIYFGFIWICVLILYSLIETILNMFYNSVLILYAYNETNFKLYLFSIPSFKLYSTFYSFIFVLSSIIKMKSPNLDTYFFHFNSFI